MRSGLLGCRISPEKRSSEVLAAGLICLLTGSELFFRYAGLPWMKLLSVCLIAAGVVAFGAVEWSLRLLALRGAAAFVYGAYLAQACWRFFGLLKEHRPYAATDVAWLVLRVELVLAVPMLVVGVVAGYWEKRRAV